MGWHALEKKTSLFVDTDKYLLLTNLYFIFIHKRLSPSFSSQCSNLNPTMVTSLKSHKAQKLYNDTLNHTLFPKSIFSFLLFQALIKRGNIFLYFPY